MKRRALLSLLLLACASRSSFDTPNRMLECTGEIEVRASLAGSTTSMDRVGDRLMIVVEVANNSHQDIVVKKIVVEDVELGSSQRLGSSFSRVDETILEGQARQFKIPLTVRGRFEDTSRPTRDPVPIAVTVSLEGGDSYRCQFTVQPPIA